LAPELEDNPTATEEEAAVASFPIAVDSLAVA
jgi:hypothetical protein